MLKKILEALKHGAEKAGEEVAKTAAQEEAAALIQKLPAEERKALLEALQAGNDNDEPTATAPVTAPVTEEAAPQADTKPEAETTAKAVETVPAASPAPAVERGAARTPQPTKQGTPQADLSKLTSSQINDLYDKGDIHRMFGQKPPQAPPNHFAPTQSHPVQVSLGA